MFKPDEYIPALIELLKAAYKERLLYVGLQGSYLRDEATEHSDIDIMVVISNMSVADLAKYREAISFLDDYDKSCGFICGIEELQNWNPLEICHLLHTTKDYYGTLAKLVPEYTETDVRNFVKMSLGNLYHEICHRYIHAPKEKNVSKLPFTYRSVFFILQNLYYLNSGKFVGTKKGLREALSGKNRLVLETAISLSKDNLPHHLSRAEKLLEKFYRCQEEVRAIYDLLPTSCFSDAKNLKIATALYQLTIHSEDAYTTVAQISDKSGVSPEKVQDCLESDLSQFILEKEGPESQFRFEGMYMNILPIISLFDFK